MTYYNGNKYESGYGTAPPPPYKEDYTSSSQQYSEEPRSREDRFREIISKHEISNEFSARLQLLNGFKIVFIFDDSGSMSTILQDSPLNTSNTLFRATRWDELRYFASIAIDIASLFDQAGSDVYFLNRQPSPVRNVKNMNDLQAYFTDKPNGFTPLSRVLMTVLEDNHISRLNEKKLLIIIATDGEPTNDQGKGNIVIF